ncbi:MAG: hypothetical protein HYT94_05065 [Parcubacteria group bacterium]|nr:hypothetical protein [Parcubacteria group bacterium]
MEDFSKDIRKKLKGLDGPGTKRICHEIQIVFKSDADLKEKTLEKAKIEGVTLKAVLTMAMRAYVNDEMVLGMWRREEFYDDKGDSPPGRKEKETVVKKKMLKKKPSPVKSPLSVLAVNQKKRNK